MSEIQERLAGLSPEKLKLLSRRLGRKPKRDTELPALEPKPDQRHEPFPLTEVQHAYWMGRSSLYELGGVSAHGYQEIDVQGLDVARFEGALRRLVRRHDMLRMVILDDGRQRVLDDVPPYTVQVLDLRGREPEVARRALERLRHRLSHQVLSADEWPLFDIRASLLDGGRVRVHISFDILVGDLASYQILLADLGRFYADPDVELPALEATFRDYVVTVESLRGSALEQRAWDYWRQRLEELPAGPQLPLAREPGEIGTPRFSRREASLGPADWETLQAKARSRGITPSGLLLAAFAEVLAVWSKEPRFTINLTLFNRLPIHPQVNQVVGDFTSLTLLAVDRDAGDSFVERARLFQQQLWRDLEHSFVGGVSLMRELARLHGGEQPRMPVVFTSSLTDGANEALEQAQTRAADAGGDDGGVLGETVFSISQTPQVWLDHQIYERHGTLGFNWDAIEELFPPGLLDDMFAAYRQLLQDLVAGEGLEGQEVGPPAEQLAVRREVADTAAPLPEAPLHAPFLERAAEEPDRPAVIDAEGEKSYGEILRRAAHLSRRLRDEGVEAGELVAVVLEKGWRQVVAVLAILGTGAAYLPVQASQPAARRRRILERGQCRFAVAPPGDADPDAWPEGLRRLSLSGDEGEMAAEGASLAADQGPEDLAYVIFTSGSTGEPKGVMIDHRGAANTVLDVNRRFEIGPGDRVLGVSALAFDLSVWDIFGTLAAGGALVLPESAARRDPGRWLELLREHRVTIWNSVPALLQMLVEHVTGGTGAARNGSRHDPPGPLRLFLLSGDWIPLSLPPRVRELWPEGELWSLGGATEASIWSILYPVREVKEEWASVPYGRPMDNQSFHVLDSRLRPRPDWVPGELYIGGVGLAQGYWRDPERTAQSFLTHPDLGEGLYRTGDLGRFLPSGDIEFLGREDHQVKVQGHRIELGEIETALESHPAVETAVVVATGERTSRRLAAFTVVADGAAGGPAPAVHPYELQQIEFRLGEHGVRRDFPESPAPGAPSPVALERPAPETVEELFAERRTRRRFAEAPVPREALARLLASLLREEVAGSPLPRALYPSAGTLYPVQAYVHVRPGRVEGLEGGLYYHHPRRHELVFLHPGDLSPDLHPEVNRPTWEACAFSIFLVAALDAVEPVYDDRAMDFSLLEAGAMTQLLMTVAPQAGLGLCPVGEVDFTPVARGLGVGDRHRLLHALLGGVEVDGEPQAAPTGVAGDEIRRHLAERLPEYMVPAALFHLDSMPLTANGKVDRKALVARAEGQMGGGEGPVQPRTETERTLVALWRDLLDDPGIGVRDDFFAHGGDSILAIRFLTTARESGLEITPQQFFENTTVEALAALFAGDGGGDVDGDTPGADAEGGDDDGFAAADLPDEDLDELLSSFDGEGED